MATIKEVALKAGVSTATVSRVLNGNYPVSDDAERKVLDAVNSLNYRVNAVAKSLKMNKTNTIALVIPSIDNDYVMSVATGISNILNDKEYTLVIYFTGNDDQKEKEILRNLYENRTDGIILYSFQNNGKKIQKYINQGTKIIFVDSIVPDVKTICIVENNEIMSYQAVNNAIQIGHKKIGILKGIAGSNTAEERFNGFLKALNDNGLIFEERYAVEGYFNRGITHYNVKKMLQENIDDLPTLIFSTNNHMTEGALIAINELGLSVPQDISIISYGDISVPKLYNTRLTVVQQNPIIMGEKAASTLLEIVEEHKNLKYEEHIIDSQIIERDSVKRL